jgi:hypothetical protein
MIENMVDRDSSTNLENQLQIEGKLKKRRWGFRIFVIVATISIALNVVLVGAKKARISDLDNMRSFSARILNQNRFLVRLIDFNKEHIEWSDVLAAADGVIAADPLTPNGDKYQYNFIWVEYEKNGTLKNIEIAKYPQWVHDLYRRGDVTCWHGECLQGKESKGWWDGESFSD